MTQRLAGIPAPKTPADKPAVLPGHNPPPQVPRPPKTGPAAPGVPGSNRPIRR
jgi:hypothetical protein